VIPTRFLNLPVFVGLLERAEEDGFRGDGDKDFLVYFGFFAEVLDDSARLECWMV
jgi:CO dehydrogenase/acetyl-CoA synthase epsilon subunit